MDIPAAAADGVDAPVRTRGRCQLIASGRHAGPRGPAVGTRAVGKARVRATAERGIIAAQYVNAPVLAGSRCRTIACRRQAWQSGPAIGALAVGKDRVRATADRGIKAADGV